MKSYALLIGDGEAIAFGFLSTESALRAIGKYPGKTCEMCIIMSYDEFLEMSAPKYPPIDWQYPEVGALQEPMGSVTPTIPENLGLTFLAQANVYAVMKKAIDGIKEGGFTADNGCNYSVWLTQLMQTWEDANKGCGLEE